MNVDKNFKQKLIFLCHNSNTFLRNRQKPQGLLFAGVAYCKLHLLLSVITPIIANIKRTYDQWKPLSEISNGKQHCSDF